MLIMPAGQSCAIHSVGIIAPGTTSSGFVSTVDGIDAMGKSDLIDQHSYISQGYYNVRSGSPGTGGGAANLEIYDSALNNANNINALINSPNAKLVRNSFAGAGIAVPTTSISIQAATTAATASPTLSFASFGSSGPPAGSTISSSSTTIPASAVVLSSTPTSVTMNIAPYGTVTSGTTLSFASPTGENIKFAAADIVISDNIIQQSSGNGILLKSARSARITSNFFDNDGKTAVPSGAIEISNSGNVTVCGNTFSENALGGQILEAEGSTGLYPAHIIFDGTDDTVALCGNVYIPELSSGSNGALTSSIGSVLLRPDYDYDVSANASLTNISIADNPAIQNLGVLSTSTYATVLVGSLNTHPSIAGLALTNSAGSGTFSVGSGAATDSTNQSLIAIAPGTSCTLNLINNGANGLDVGTATTGVTYNVFVVSGLGGLTPTCVASAGTVPNFTSFATPLISMQSQGTIANATKPDGSISPMAVIYNIGENGGGPNALSSNPLAGMAIGNSVVSSGTLAAGATISSMAPYNIVNFTGATIALSGTTYYTSNCIEPQVINSSGTFLVSNGMNVAGGLPPSSTVIAAGQTVTVNGSTLTCYANRERLIFNSSTATIGAATLHFGGDFTLFVNGASVLSSGTIGVPITFKVQGGLYRLIGTYTKTS